MQPVAPSRPARMMRRLQPLGLALGLALAYPVAGALPQGAQVVQGQVTVSPGLVQQGSSRAIVNWQSFSIGAGETLRVQQPDVNAVLLNRVVGGDPSLILGQLQSNGRVFLVNPRGIVFGRGSQVDVGGLVASTLDLSDTDFLAGAYRFSAGAQAGALRAEGRISAPGGTVALVAPELAVSGLVEARRVGLAAGSTVQVDVEGDGLVLFNLRNDDARAVSLQLSGQVLAAGSAELRAQARAGVAGQVLNMDGLVQARGLRQQGGRILIDGGTAGDTLVRGRLDASGDTGGQVTVLGQRVALLDAAQVDVSGRQAGGEVQIGGGVHGEGTAHNAEHTVVGAGAEIRADATEQGAGGRVAVWADRRTDVLGRISARGGRLGGDGGFVETSGREILHMPRGSVDVSAPRGRAGQWLLDPYNLTIQDTAGAGGDVLGPSPFTSTGDDGVLDVHVLNTALASGGTVIVQTGSGGAQSGLITVDGDIHATVASGLNLVAAGSINFTGAGRIRATGTSLALRLQAGGSVDTTAGSIDLQGGDLTITAPGGIRLGTVQAVRSAVLSSTTGDIETGNLQTTQALQLSTTTGAARLGAVTVGGGLNFTSTSGALTQTGALNLTGGATINTGGAVTLDQTGNTLRGTLALTAGATQLTQSGSTALTLGTLNTGLLTARTGTGLLNLGQGTVAGLDVLTTGGGITQGGATLQVNGTATLSSGAGSMTLGALNTTGALSVTTSSGAVSLGSVVVGNGLSFTSTSGTLTQTGALDLTGGATINTGGAVTLDQTGNTLRGTLDLTAGATRLTQSGSTALTLGTLNTGLLTARTGTGLLTLGQGTVAGLDVITTGGGITQGGGTLQVNGSATLSSGAGAVTLGALNTTGALSVTTSSGAVSLGSVVVGNGLSFTSTSGTLTQTAALDLTGGATINTGGAVTLDQTGNTLRGTLDLTAGATRLTQSGSTALTLGTLNTGLLTARTGTGLLTLGPGTVAGLDVITTGGGITQGGGTLQVNGAATLSAGAGAVTLGAVNTTGALSLTTSSGAVSLGNVVVGNGLSFTSTSGTLTQTGALDLTGGATINTGGAVTLDQTGNTLRGTLALTAGATRLTQSGSTALTLGTLNTGLLTARTGTGLLTLGPGTVAGLDVLTTGGGITQGGATLQANGTATLSSGAGSVTLGAVTTTGALSLTTSTGAASLGSVVVGNGLSFTSTSGTLTQTGALDLTGGATINTGGAVTLDQTGNTLRGTLALTAGATRLTQSGSNALTLGTLNTGLLTARTGTGLLTLGQGTVAGLDLITTGGGITQGGGTLQVNGSATLSSGAGAVTLGAVNTTGALSLTTSTGAASLGSVVVGNGLSFTSTSGTLTQTAALDLTGGATINTGGAVTLNQAGNALRGTLDLTASSADLRNGGSTPITLGSVTTSGALQVTTASGAVSLGTTTVGGPLTVSSTSGSLGQTGPLDIGGAATLQVGGALTLADARNDLRGNVTLGGSAVTLVTQGDLHLVGLARTPGQALVLDAGQQLWLPTGLTSLDTGGNPLTLASRGAAFTTPGLLQGGDITLIGQSVALAHDITATGRLTVQTGNGALQQSGGRLSVGGTSHFTAVGGGIELLQAGNVLQSAVDLAGGNTRLTVDGDLRLGQVSLTGTLDARSTTGALLQTAQGVAVSQAASFTAAGAITLDAAANDWGGTVSLSGGAARLQGQGAVALGSVGVSSLWLRAGGPVSQAQALTLTGDLTVDAGTAAIQLGHGSNLLTGTVSLRGGTTQLHTQGALSLGAVQASGDLTLSSRGLLRQTAGAWTVAGRASLDAGTAGITLDRAANQWGGAVSLHGGAVTLQGGATQLGTVDVGTLTVTTTGALSQDSGTVRVAGALTVNAGTASIDLRNAGNQLGGVVTLQGGSTQLQTQAGLTLGAVATGSLTVQSHGALNLGQGTVSGALSADSGNAPITQTGDLRVTGAASFASGSGDITLPQSGNAFLDALSLTGRAVTVFNQPSLAFGSLSFSSLDATSNGSIQLGSGTLTGTLTARALGGGITQAPGGLSVAGVATLQARDGIALPQANHFNNTVHLSGGSTVLRNDSPLRLGTLAVAGLDLTVAGSLDLGSGTITGALAALSTGALGQTGALTVSGPVSLDAGSAAITLGQAGNQFAGSVGLRGGPSLLTATGDLHLGALNVAGLTVSSSGVLGLGTGTVGGDLSAQGMALTQASGGLAVTGVARLDAGSGSLTLDEAGNAFAGRVALNAGNVMLRNGTDLRLGPLAVNQLTLDVAGSLDLGSGAVQGPLSATSQGPQLTQTGALTVGGPASFVAQGGAVDLRLDQPGNQWLGPVTLGTAGGGRFSSASLASALDLTVSGDAQALTLDTAGRLTLGGGQHQTLTAAARGGIVQTGALQVSGETTLIARGSTSMAVDLRQAGNDLGGVTLAADAGGSLGRVQLNEGDASRHDGLRVTGDATTLAVTAAGPLDLGGGRYASLAVDTSAAGAAVTQSGGLAVSGAAQFQAGTGALTLTRSDNRLPSVTVGSAGAAALVSQGDYTVGPSAVSTRLALGGAGAITLAGPLSGTGELQMTGTGSLTLDSAHTYTGGTRIDSGRLVLQGPAAVPGSGAVRVGAAGQLDLRDGASLASEVVAQGGRISASAGRGTLTGPVSLQATAVFEAGAGGLWVNGPVRDGGAGFGLRQVGSGVLTLAGGNAYGGMTDVAAGTLQAASAGALPAGSPVQVAAGATLALGADQALGSLTGAGRVALGTFTLTTGADGTDTRFDGDITGSGSLVKQGTGRFTLGGRGEHTGATQVAAGELVLAGADALTEATAVSVDAGARLTVQQAARLGSLAGAGTVDLQAASLTVGARGDSTRWAGTLSGSGALIKAGAGTFTLAGSSSFSGGLQVLGGTLQLDTGGARAQAVRPAAGPVLPAATAVTVAGGATLALLGDVAVDTLAGAGQVALGSSTLTVGAAGGSSRFEGALAGSGGLVKAGAGSFTLAGANTFSGATRVAGGQLVLDAEQTLSSRSALVIEAAGRVQANAAQAVASLSGEGELGLNGARLAAGADGRDSRFDGLVSGTGSLVKQGAGMLTLTAANTYSGGTRIEAGALQLAGQGLLGTGAVQNDGQLVLARSEALTLDPTVSGTGSLVITQGQVTLAQAGNSYSGATLVQGGRLVTSGAERLPDASAVQVAAGAQLELGGSETVASLQAAGDVRLGGHFTTQGEQVYTGSLTLAGPGGLTLAGSLIDASRSRNQFGTAPLGLKAGQALLSAPGTLVLGDVALSQGGQLQAERVVLEGALQLTGGALTLTATAAPDEAKASVHGTAQVPVAALPMALAEATVAQGAASTITLAAGARLQVNASGGGSVQLARDGNRFQGELAVLSGAAYNTAWQPHAQGGLAIQSQVRVAGQQLNVGGSGIEADLIDLRADQLATVGTAALVARLPFDQVVLGRALSAPGLTLTLAPGAFAVPGSFGSVNGQAIQVAVGSAETGGRTTGPNAGWVSVLPKGGAQGATAVVLAGPPVGRVPAGGGTAYRFFHDGAAQPTEIPVAYNGVVPLTPAASGTLSSINGDAEDARRARFQETVRTENVTVRLRSGVIAEVGPGRASTQGSEGARPPELCDPADQPVLSCKPPALP